MEVRFHLDEHIHPAIAVGLRRRGIDVTTAVEVGLLSAPDEDHLAFALREGRVIMTHDEDYLVLDSKGTAHAGIAYCHPRAGSIGEIVHGLVLIYECMAAEEMRGHVEFL